MKSFSTCGTFVNFLIAEEGPERTHAALVQNLCRLAENKARWDPQDVLRTDQSVTPG